MSNTGRKLLDFMTKWSGKSGGLILLKEIKKLEIKEIEKMTDEEKIKLLTTISNDCLITFLGRSRFLVARAELISILSINENDYRIEEPQFRNRMSFNRFGR